MTTLGPLFVATTENFRAQLNDTIQLLMRQDLRDACTHRKKVKLDNKDDIYRIVRVHWLPALLFCNTFSNMYKST